ncbi:MAG: signal recognition particle-docking protein FtsY [Calditrichota bacterium]
MSLLDKFKLGLQKTRESAFAKLSGLFRRGKFDESALDELEEVLIEADVGVAAGEELIRRVRLILKDERTSNNDPKSILKSELEAIIGEPAGRRAERFSVKPWIILLAGVNGSGKTTTAGKLAYLFTRQGKKVAIAAADTFRAAAVEQVEIWAERGGARLIRQSTGADPGAVVFDACQSVRARGEDVLIVDTAGRLQDKRNLMAELEKITRVMKRADPQAPHEVLLVLDAINGQNGISQARGFSQAAAVTGLVVTKLDGSARGGVVVPILREMQIPIEYIGLGEGIDDLLPFNRDHYIEALLDV